MTPYPSARAQLGVFASLLTLSMLPACKPADPVAQTPAQAERVGSENALPVNKEASNMADQAHESQADQSPAPEAVMYFIYNKDGDGATSYEIDDGSIATYWYGQQFELDGKRYFTGFAYNTPQKFSQAQKEGVPDPLTPVTLTQATFVSDKPGTEKPWRAISAELFIGEFGSSEKANPVDTSRQAISKETADGRLVLAVPTSGGSGAEAGPMYSLFRFNPGELEDTEDRHWRYLGDVAVASGASSLEFVPASTGGKLPDVKVRPRAAPEGIPLNPDGTLTYVYDEDNKAYVVLQ